jgi:hypothetical protein
MKKYLIIAFLLLFSSLLVKAQDIPHRPQPDSLIKIIPVGEGNETSFLYTIGGKLQTRKDVEIRLMAYAPSAGELKMAKNNLTWTYVSAGGLAASTFAAVIEFANNNKHAGETTGFVNGQPTFIYQQHNLTGAYIFTGLATGFLFATIINWTNVFNHGKKAMHLYNQRFE